LFLATPLTTDAAVDTSTTLGNTSATLVASLTLAILINLSQESLLNAQLHAKMDQPRLSTNALLAQ